ncbi:MAG: hypothetical protein ACI9AD_000691 [Nitriliruptoraceae bacterium]
MTVRYPRAAAVAVSALVVAAIAVPTAGRATVTDDSVSVLLISIDALDPAELDELDENGNPLAPNLVSLRDQGTWWTQARSVMASETLPNHIAMGTGTYPGTNGVPGNDGRLWVGDTALADPDLGVPEARLSTSTISAIESQCGDLRTVTDLSKEYVWRTFAGEADEDFDQPSFNIPASGHAPESATVPFLLNALDSGPIDHAFVNLGDHDRAGHVDVTGAAASGPDTVTDGPRSAQRAALSQVDSWIGTITNQLQQSGEWDRTVLMVVSDHSMNFTLTPDPRWNIDVAATLEQVETDNALIPGTVFLFSDNGGAGFVYLIDPAMDGGDALLTEAYDAIAAMPGVEDTLYRLPNTDDPDGRVLGEIHPDWHLDGTDRVGEILVLAEERYRMGSESDNPLPGNHGHTSTRHITALITGGWDGIVSGTVVAASNPDAVNEADDTAALPEQAEQVDWAPTVGWLLGVTDPGLDAAGDAQWEGRVLDEAFSRRPGTLACAAAVARTDSGSNDTAADDAGAPVVDSTGSSLAGTGGGAALAGLIALAGAGSLRRRSRRC